MSGARGELPVDEPTDSGNGVTGFAVAVVRRIDRRVVTLALLILLVAQVAFRLGKLGFTHLG
ncbi:MAG: hypothetical protein M3Y55_05865, partial [Pseudomonadota bacterium]|nr:hypothetical protein [Pseudomonadota bacterium]